MDEVTSWGIRKAAGCFLAACAGIATVTWWTVGHPTIIIIAITLALSSIIISTK